MADGGVPGVEDVAALGRWLAGQGLAGDGLPRVSIIGGGRSNLTYRLDLGAAGGTGRPPLILRRPPLGHVLPTAHDMAREYRVLTALAGTAVPVPRPVALCPDPEIIGAPFYLMEYVPGAVLRTAEDAAVLTPAQAGELSRTFVRMLASIHGLDVEAAGLAGFGRPEGYLARQLSRWQRQWELSATREMPGYDELVSRLAAGLPGTGGRPEGAGGLVHGDYRLDNMLVVPGPEPRIAAVVDWEMSTLGDPLADLGLSLVYWTDPGEEDWLPAASVTTAPGFLSRAQLAGEYARVTGRDLARIGYYMAFGCFKLAVVLEGINARFLQHKTVGEGFEREGQAVPVLIARAHELLDGTAH
ncbi:MAG TPA: phosphotransferase family protein [Streptosporangiaceae bacterium]